MKTRFFRIAKAGATIDGREITEQQIEQMAASYDPAKYGARIWIEHFRSLYAEGSFPAMGDVLALEVERAGEDVYLSASIDPTPALVSMSQNRQKVFWSIEMDSKFSDTGEAYLTGLAATDTPASLGTEIMKFSVEKKPAEFENKLFSEKLEADWQLEEQAEDQAEDQGPKTTDGLFAKVKNLLSKKDKQDGAQFQDLKQSVLLTAEGLSGHRTETATALEGKAAAADVTALTSDLTTLRSEFNSLKDELSRQRQGEPRHQAHGDNTEFATDC